MRVRLHPDFVLSGRALFDTVLGTRYKISPDALLVLRHIRQEVSVDCVVRTIAGKRAVSTVEARNALYILLGYLDGCGGIIVHDSSLYERLRRIRLGGWQTRRYEGTWRGFIGSMCRAYGMLLVAGTLLSVGAGMAADGLIPFIWVLLPAGLLASCVLHEAGHAFAARHEGVPRVFLARPGFAAVMYARPSRRRERRIALCGPFVAAVVCMIAAVLVPDRIGRIICVTTGLLQISSLLPWTADGKTFWRKL